MFARTRIKKVLKNIPHVISLAIDYCEGLPKNKDMFASKPDVYVLVNTYRKVGKQERCYTTGKTRAILGNTDPCFDESLRLSCAGHSGLVVINVMSKHTMAADTLIGQAIINLDNHQELYKGAVHNLKIPLTQLTHDVHDTTGSKMKLPPSPSPEGFICLSVNIPTIYHNMCGWFWAIKEDFLRGTTGEKMWVILHDKILYVYNNPFDSEVRQSIDVTEISAIKEARYDKMEIMVDGINIVLIKKSNYGVPSTQELMWAWGDDAAKTKGLWRRALIHHDPNTHC